MAPPFLSMNKLKKRDGYSLPKLMELNFSTRMPVASFFSSWLSVKPGGVSKAKMLPKNVRVPVSYLITSCSPNVL